MALKSQAFFSKYLLYYYTTAKCVFFDHNYDNSSFGLLSVCRPECLLVRGWRLRRILDHDGGRRGGVALSRRRSVRRRPLLLLLLLLRQFGSTFGATYPPVRQSRPALLALLMFVVVAMDVLTSPCSRRRASTRRGRTSSGWSRRCRTCASSPRSPWI